MPENWNFYLHQVGENTASTFLNLAIREGAPDQCRPFLFKVQLKMQLPKDNGLSSNEEFAILGAVEDKLAGELKRTREATFVGRTTVSGVRDFYYYASELIDRIAIKETTAQFPEYRFECSCTHDPGWLHYLEVLYPTDEEFETIKNQYVLEALRKNGDDLSQGRPVTHWSFFKTQQDRQAFLSEALEMGFSIHDLHEDWDEEYPLVACLERTDNVDYDSINSAIIDLLRLTETHHGTYDGWETQVVEDGTEHSEE